MSEPFFQQIVVPVADRGDAAATTNALDHYLEGSDATVVAVHVIEKTSGGPDKAPVEQRETRAEDVFEIVSEGLDDIGITVKTELRYGTDITASIIEAAHDRNASAIVFTPRGGSRWRKLLTGDIAHKLVSSSDVPVVVLPDCEVNET